MCVSRHWPMQPVHHWCAQGYIWHADLSSHLTADVTMPCSAAALYRAPPCRCACRVEHARSSTWAKRASLQPASRLPSSIATQVRHLHPLWAHTLRQQCIWLSAFPCRCLSCTLALCHGSHVPPCMHSNPSSHPACPVTYVSFMHMPHAPGVWKHGASHQVPATCHALAVLALSVLHPSKGLPLLQRGWMWSGMTCLPCCM